MTMTIVKMKQKTSLMAFSLASMLLISCLDPGSKNDQPEKDKDQEKEKEKALKTLVEEKK